MQNASILSLAIQLVENKYIVGMVTCMLCSIIVDMNRTQRIKDQNELKRSRDELALALSKLKKTEQVKDEFISIASHELKTPLTSIKGFAYLLKKRLVRDKDRKGSEYLEKIDQYVNKITRLVNDLLDVSKIQTDKLTIEKKIINIDSLISDVALMVRQTDSDHQIILKGKSRAKVFGDRYRIEQVVQNLLTNAIKYSPGKKRVEVTITKGVRNIEVSIKDYGVGIAQKNLSKVFERFYRVDETAQKFSGLGIGLYISSEIIRRHKGSIWVKSQHGRGSTFYFTLPLYQS